VRLGHDILGIAAALNKRHHARALREAGNHLAQCHHRSAVLQPGRGQPVAVFSGGALVDIVTVDACG